MWVVSLQLFLSSEQPLNGVLGVVKNEDKVGASGVTCTEPLFPTSQSNKQKKNQNFKKEKYILLNFKIKLIYKFYKFRSNKA